MAAEVTDAAVSSKFADATNARAAASAPRSLSVRTYWVITGVVTSLAFGFRVWFGSKGYFWGDDLLLRDSALDATGPGFLVEVHGGHVSVIGAAAQWVMLHTFTNSYLVTVLWSAALLAGTQIALAALFLRLQGPRWVGIVASSFAVLTLFTVEISTWWSVGKYAAPLMLGTSVSLLALTLYLESPSTRRAALIVAAVALCVLSDANGAAVLVLLWGMAGAVPIVQSRPRGFWRVTQRHWGLWVSLSIIVVAATGTRFVQGETLSPELSPETLIAFVVGEMRDAVVPAAWGGPWSWFFVSYPNWPGWHGGPAPTFDERNLAMAGAVLGLTVLLLLRPVLWRWASVVIVFAIGAGILGGLGIAGGPFAVPAMRYVYDVAVPLAILLALALCPTRWEARPYSQIAERELARWFKAPQSRTVVATASVATLVLSTVISYRAPVAALGNVFSRTYVGNALGTAESADAELLDQLAPDAMGTVTASEALRSFDGAPRFTLVSYQKLLGLSEDGKVEAQRVQGAAAPPGPWPECGYLAGTDLIDIPISAEDAPGYTIELGYGTTAPVPLEVMVGSSTRLILLPAGRGTVYFGTPGPAKSVKIRTSVPGTVACVSKFVIGARIGTGLDGPTEVLTAYM